MKTSEKKQKSPANSHELAISKEVTVRGSGFTYTEKVERTDKSVPVSEVNKEDIVPLPDLGQKNRP